ncbi:hypothetical protein FD23_GL000397 [Lactobacillus delbrueckii subsp. delbrueckii DSM 20074 = JCM 1012]|nr:hypothetical protein FD23_GL000397 [Lactobacillus delbrueckii subsp. delbrueckii DSM 20074 = JCM 1012]
MLKEGSRFVCQTCGAAYSADQLRRQFDLPTRRRFMLKPSRPTGPSASSRPGSCIWP